MLYFSSSTDTYCRLVMEKWIPLNNWDVDHGGDNILESNNMADGALSIYFPYLISELVLSV